MPRVLQVLEATIGGTRRHLRELSLGLVDRGWQVDVAVATRRSADFGRDLELFAARGIGVHPVAMRRRVAPLSDAVALWQLAALLRRLRPDVIHAHSSKAGLLARLAAHRVGLPVVYTPHVFAFEMDAARPLRAFYRCVERAAAPWCDRLIAVSEHEARAARGVGYPADRVVVVANGVPAAVPALPPAPVRAACQVAFAGRLCAQKGPDVLITAAAQLRPAFADLRVTIMGDGAWRSRLQRRVRREGLGEVVAFLPAGDLSAVDALLRSCTVLAMPSRWEGLPYALLEAMQAETPVVASCVGGVGEVVRDGREALLVPPDSPAALAQALGRLLGDAELRARIGACARVRAEAFRLEDMLSSIERVYRDVLRRNTCSGRTA